MIGLLILPGAIINGFMGLMVGRLTDRFGGKRMMGLALLGMALGFHLLSKADGYTSKATLVMTIAFYIGFVGAVFTPLNYVSLACLSPRHPDTGASMIHVIRFIAGALGTAFATSHLEMMRHFHFLGMSRNPGPSHPLLIPYHNMLKAYLLGHGQHLNWIQTQLSAFLKGYLTIRGYIFAFQDCMVIFGLASLLSLFLVPFIAGKRQDIPLYGG